MISEGDERVVEAQLRRPMRGGARVASRCHLGLPVVLDVAPVLPDGEPFPTLYWLSCPLAHRRVARLESGGAVRAMDARAAEDPVFRAELDAAHERYAAARAERLPLAPSDPAHGLRGGVGGAIGGTKCLHAHLAHHLADGPNPVGAAIAGDVLPLDCDRPCVAVGKDGVARRDPAWVEPRVERG